MHPTQQKLVELIDKEDISELSLREIGRRIGISNPQVVKHHLEQLRKLNLKTVKVPTVGKNILQNSISIDKITFDIPLLGFANCGAPSFVAEETANGYLTVSNSIVKSTPGLFALIAQGESMNAANINGNAISTGDYVIVDSNKRNPSSGDYVVSVIDGYANIKKFHLDKEHKQIALISESKQEFPDIIIAAEDFNQYMVSGTVVRVVKKIKVR